MHLNINESFGKTAYNNESLMDSQSLCARYVAYNNEQIYMSRATPYRHKKKVKYADYMTIKTELLHQTTHESFSQI